MAGCSIWLIPPPSHPLTAALTTLIQKTLPPHFKPEDVPSFVPHVTLTSDVPTDVDLAALVAGLPETIPSITFEKVDIGQTFFTRVTLRVKKTDEIKQLAKELRSRFAESEADKWAEETFRPHLSLVYAERDPKEVEKILLPALLEEVQKAGVPFWSAAWTGGKIVLVDTSKKIGTWKIVGEREL